MQKLIRILAFCLSAAFIMAACTKEEPSLEDDGVSMEELKSLASKTSIRTKTLNGREALGIYMDSSSMYLLHLYRNFIFLAVADWKPEERVALFGDRRAHIELQSCGCVSGLDSVEKLEYPERGNPVRTLEGSIFMPSFGYSAYFETETGEIKYLRIYAKDYTLNPDSTLCSVTLQYQLF